MEILRQISKKIDALNNWVGRTISWLTVLLILVVCLDVLRRKLFSQTEAWITELECYLFALLFLFGAGYTFLHDRHVRVDVFFANQSKKDKAWTNIAGIILLLLPWCGILIYWGIHYAWQSFLVGEGSPNPNGLPALYLMKFAIPIALFLLLLQGLSELIKSILIVSEQSKSEMT